MGTFSETQCIGLIFVLVVWAVLGITGVTNESANNHRPISRKLGIAAFHVLQYFSFCFIVFSIISIVFVWTAS